MKKVLIGICTVLLVVSVAVTGVVAANRDGRYTDADGNGVCDRYETGAGNGTSQGGQNADYTDADGNGVCDRYETGAGNGASQGRQNADYTDADGNGVCDRYEAGNCLRAGMKREKKFRCRQYR